LFEQILLPFLHTEMGLEKKINDYDYNKMLTEFKTDELKHKQYVASSKKFKATNDRWKKTQEIVKERKEYLLEQEREEEIKKMEKKHLAGSKHLKALSEIKSNIVKEMERKTEEKLKNAKENVVEMNKNLEQMRLSVESRINSNLMRLSFKNKQHIDQKKQHYTDKFLESTGKFQQNYRNILTEKYEEFVKSSEKPVDKYAKWYISHYKNKIQEQNIRKDKTMDKLSRYREKSLDREEELKKKGEEIILDLEHKAEIRNELQRKHSEELHRKGKMMNEKYMQLLEKQSLMKRGIDTEHQRILENQVSKMNKVQSIEALMGNQKSHSQVKNLVFYMESEKKIFTFYKDLNVQKSQSMMKLSPDKKRKIYLSKKKQEEEEQKNKEQEELKRKDNN